MVLLHSGAFPVRLGGTVPIAFTRRMLDVVPAHTLTDGQSVQVRGTGYTPGPVVVSLCGSAYDTAHTTLSVFEQCANTPIARTVTVADDGTFSLSFTVRSSFPAILGGTRECAVPESCLVLAGRVVGGVFGLVDAATVLLSFGAPAVGATPASGLVHGQQIAVSGTNLTPGPWQVSECSGAIGASPTAACAPSTSARFPR